MACRSPGGTSRVGITANELTAAGILVEPREHGWIRALDDYSGEINDLLHDHAY